MPEQIGLTAPCPSCNNEVTVPERQANDQALFVVPTKLPFLKSHRKEIFDLSLDDHRSFSSYDDCPEIYYRFNGKGEYGPRKLDVIVSFFTNRSEEAIEGRFADEQQWRPLKSFLGLWECIPLGTNTLKRLGRERIDPDGLSEASARCLLRQRNASKAPTPRQIDQLRSSGIAVSPGLSRGDAQKLIHEHERALAEVQRRREEAPEMEGYKRKLEELAPTVREFIPDWLPTDFDDAVSYMCYVSVIEDALDHARSYDLTQLRSDLFYDGLDIAVGYYLEFTRDPTPTEIHNFQAALCRAYVDAESERFDHLAILRQTLPMIRPSLIKLDE